MEINPKFKKVAIQAAKEAGNFLFTNLGRAKIVKEKTKNNYVTDADIKSEKIITSLIEKNFSNHEILAEESGKTKKKSDYLWLIDPLDGTHNYAASIPIYAVSVALYYKNRPIIGVINLPHQNEIYEAEAGKGAYLNKKIIRVSRINSLKDAFILPETNFRVKKSEKFRILKITLNQTKRVRLFGAIVFQLAYVAAGRVEGVIGQTGYPWDYAAGALIVQEAGGKSTNLKGEKYNIKDQYLVATNGKIHNQLLKLIKK